MVIDSDKHFIAMNKLALLTRFFINKDDVVFSEEASAGMFYILTDIIQELTPQEGNQIEVSK